MASTHQGVGLGSSHRTRRRRGRGKTPGAGHPDRESPGRPDRVARSRRRSTPPRFTIRASRTLHAWRTTESPRRRAPAWALDLRRRARRISLHCGWAIPGAKKNRARRVESPRSKERRDNFAQRCIIRRSRRRILRRRGAQARGGRLAAFRFEPCLLFSHAKGLTAKRSVTQCDTTRSSS